jgi:hypothetical protein
MGSVFAARGVLAFLREERRQSIRTGHAPAAGRFGNPFQAIRRSIVPSNAFLRAALGNVLSMLIAMRAANRSRQGCGAHAGNGNGIVQGLAPMTGRRRKSSRLALSVRATLMFSHRVPMK